MQAQGTKYQKKKFDLNNEHLHPSKLVRQQLFRI